MTASPESLLDLSARIIDSGVADQPVNRVTNELSELGDDLAIVESFSHCIAWDTGEGLVCFDASGAFTGQAVVEALRLWRTSPVSTLVYTHGHADHVGGSGAFAADAEARGLPRPVVVGHENVPVRLARYDLTNDWNLIINARQFGGVAGDLNLSIGDQEPGASSTVRPTGRRFLPRNVLGCDRTFREHDVLTLGDHTLELRHARGETDDHLWGWVPERKWLFTGDFLIWNFPNAGNPQKVQRYPKEWAAALRTMAATGAELLLPAHGLPIAGADRIYRVLTDIADALDDLVDRVVAMMNAGATLDTIIHEVQVPAETLAKPYLRPLYDEPEFVVRNVWRLYGGWWDGAASRLKPSPDAHLATALAELAGGVDVLVRRAEAAASDGDLRLACHLADLAGWAAPDDPDVHRARAEIYLARRKQEPSLMAKGIFAAAARESQLVAERPGT
jgi:glyoxylase-like metal-dependent hydrolase (beta-lactamase superfamily II)